MSLHGGKGSNHGGAKTMTFGPSLSFVGLYFTMLRQRLMFNLYRITFFILNTDLFFFRTLYHRHLHGSPVTRLAGATGRKEGYGSHRTAVKNGWAEGRAGFADGLEQRSGQGGASSVESKREGGTVWAV